MEKTEERKKVVSEKNIRLKASKKELFDIQKEGVLKRLDHSKKGSIDDPIVNLITLLNKKKNVYTTSSCSGRMMLIEYEEEKKNKAHWPFVTHKSTSLAELKHYLRPRAYSIWFKMEPAIFHIVCRSIDDAKKLLDICDKCTFKHSGILNLNKRIIVEVMGSDVIALPIAEKGKILVDDVYLEVMVREANRKMQKNEERLKKFERECNKLE